MPCDSECIEANRFGVVRVHSLIGDSPLLDLYEELMQARRTEHALLYLQLHCSHRS
jgi:hypothetical protein